jgi:UDP-N-acetylglucosamine 2-epimerase (non-hydrolysing)
MDTKVLQESDFEDRIAVVMGTRPGIIKMSPLVKELERREIDNILIHAGQHYSYELDDTFFEDLRIPAPDHRVEGVAETTYHGEQTARMLEGIEEILLAERPAVVLVCGDANYNLAGALAARKLGMVVGHVEAGLRSNDWRMPEEHNRVIIDHISEHLFAPTEETKQNAIEDNVKGNVHVTGNTIVDAVYEHRDIAHEESNILSELGLGDDYFLVTAHREENVDDEANLTELVELLERVDNTYDADIVFSIHPRTVERLDQFGLRARLDAVESLQIIDPVGYIDFLQLQSNARTILTDSGGIQEEACIMQIPCVTLREDTERPETVEVGANVVAGTDPERVLEAIEEVQSRERDWANPFGDGTAAEQIIDVAVGEIE